MYEVCNQFYRNAYKENVKEFEQGEGVLTGIACWLHCGRAVYVKQVDDRKMMGLPVVIAALVDLDDHNFDAPGEVGCFVVALTSFV